MARDLARVLKEARKLEERLAAARAALEATTVEGTAGGGAVTVRMNCQRDVVGITIAPSALEAADASMLEDLVLSALRDARQKADDVAAREMAKIGGPGLPGF